MKAMMTPRPEGTMFPFEKQPRESAKAFAPFIAYPDESAKSFDYHPTAVAHYLRAMKTTAAARRAVKLRLALTALTIAAILGVELWMGFSMATRIGQTTGSRTDSPAVPPVSFSEMLAAR